MKKFEDAVTNVIGFILAWFFILLGCTALITVPTAIVMWSINVIREFMMVIGG